MTVAVLTGIAYVLVLGVVVGAARPRRSSGASDFYVAARAVPPWWNGAAITSEFTSAAACLGAAGLIATHGSPMLWYPAGAAAGFVVILALVVAPLRRSGTYTLPDFAEWRLRSAPLRRFTTCFVLVVGLAFLVAQLHAAGVVVRLLTGLPPWLGWAAVAAAALTVAFAGGMGSVTSVQAAQFWLKLAVFLGVGAVCWGMAGTSLVTGPITEPVTGPVSWLEGAYRAGGGGLAGAGDPSLPGVLAVLVACALGTMGLPHVIVRVYTSRDGRGARRSILATQVLLALFGVVPPLYGILGSVHVRGAEADEIVLLLPATLLSGAVGDVLTGLLAAGAFAAFLATSGGVLVAVGGALSACLSPPGVRSFRAAVLVVMLAGLALTAVTGPGVSMALVLLGFCLSAATFCPMLVLGIWWRRLTDAGVAAGFLAGGGVTAALVLAEQAGVKMGALTSCPAPVAVPVSFAAMVVISLVTPGRVPRVAGRMLARMHVPEHLAGPLTYRSSHGDDRWS
ncbi:cation/acetate symporter [Nonomuraea thailandensis]|uniref:Cation/acetate symporter n=1 Tax=Nonomuraea thailandensis TaxID=1188745 RepID=A0A9X2K402_9ACTN|nr:cation acetate symporter [Nonomuraea thailandensis]MCP2359573.1 cation/acetate symporter [Nonomuraea thailandensis]